jgi:hypothetical protein
MTFFTEEEKSILKLIWKHKRSTKVEKHVGEKAASPTNSLEKLVIYI